MECTLGQLWRARSPSWLPRMMARQRSRSALESHFFSPTGIFDVRKKDDGFGVVGCGWCSSESESEGREAKAREEEEEERERELRGRKQLTTKDSTKRQRGKNQGCSPSCRQTDEPVADFIVFNEGDWGVKQGL